ncbi:hypothetical protein [Streptomyces sp. NPDC003023]|uniref:hypothetical protein n=1 Tax=Streptomyces sp. NPDC003023 TaxID=3364675 RepID=UPI0036C482CA
MGASSGGRRVVRDAGVGVAVRGFPVVLDGVGDGGRVLGLGVALGEGDGSTAGDDDCGEGVKSFGADCATGAVGLVEPTTKWTVSITAVTLAAVHESQMSR